MHIRSVDMAGRIPGASVRMTAPGKIADSSQSVHSSGGNTDVGPAQVKQMVEEMQSYLDSMNISLQSILLGT